MKKVEVKYKRDTQSHLLFVKIIKEHTGLGLKEAKDFCDNCKYFKNTQFPIFVKDDIKFKIDIEHNFDDSIEVLNNEYQRNIKLIKLGLGDYNDMIDILSYHYIYKLDSEASIKEMLTDMELDEETLVKFFNKIIE